MFCNKCGANIPEGSVFCSSCGQKFANNSTGQQPSQPPFVPPPVYGATSGMMIPPIPKKRNTGLIVLVSILSLLAAAAIVFLCLKFFAPPEQEPDAFSDVYNTFMQSALANTAEVPQETPAPTAFPQQTPMPLDATIELPYDFVPLSYPAASFSAQQFASKAEFEAALWATSWIYQTSEVNPGAMMFNGGYVDSGIGQADNYITAYSFNNDYSFKFMKLQSSDNSIMYEDEAEFWTQEIGGVFVAAGDLEIQGVYDGVGYDVVLLLFINSQGNLVESLAMYDAHTKSVLYISNYNVFVPGTMPAVSEPPALTPITPTQTVSSTGGHTLMEWSYDEEFEEMLMAVMWQYTGTEDMPKAFDIPEYSILGASTNSLIFNTDYTLDAVLSDLTEDTINYDVGYLHAFIVIGEYEYDGVLYEVNYHYYIDSDGYLIESIKFYDFDSDEYLLVSNVNVYEPISP